MENGNTMALAARSCGFLYGPIVSGALHADILARFGNGLSCLCVVGSIPTPLTGIAKRYSNKPRCAGSNPASALFGMAKLADAMVDAPSISSDSKKGTFQITRQASRETYSAAGINRTAAVCFEPVSFAKACGAMAFCFQYARRARYVCRIYYAPEAC